ncbi:MAG: HNH endonuclease [Bacillus sp. (in: firmicutes)]
MRATFLSNIENTHTEVRKRKAFRNRLFFEIGISLPVSVSTLLSIKWNSVLKNERSLNESIVIDDEEYPISGILGEALKQYISMYRPEKLTEYIFSGKNNEPITNTMMLNILKKSAEVAGIKKNLTVQSLRKTWAATYIEMADNKFEALATVSALFGHMYPEMTLQYVYGDSIPDFDFDGLSRHVTKKEFQLCFNQSESERIPLYIGNSADDKRTSAFDIIEIERRALIGSNGNDQSALPVNVIEVEHRHFVRNRDVALCARYASKGRCALCENEAPFITEDGPYLEVHHIVALAEGGSDDLKNTVALCPNCHRKIHRVHSEDDVVKLKNRALLNYEQIKKIVGEYSD